MTELASGYLPVRPHAGQASGRTDDRVCTALTCSSGPSAVTSAEFLCWDVRSTTCQHTTFCDEFLTGHVGTAAHVSSARRAQSVPDFGRQFGGGVPQRLGEELSAVVVRDAGAVRDGGGAYRSGVVDAHDGDGRR